MMFLCLFPALDSILVNMTLVKEKDQFLKKLKVKYDPRNMMLLCQGPGHNRTCDNRFNPVLTEKGICFSFNSPSQKQVFKSSQYLEMFEKVLESAKSDTFE